MYCVLFNGPPRSGKDTLAEMLADHMDAQGVTLPVVQTSLSFPLRIIAYAMCAQEGKRLDGPDYEEFKQTEFPTLGVNGRQVMIDASEKFLKPTYGNDVMGRLLLNQLNAPHGTKNKIVLVRDSGFQIEIDVLIQALGVANVRVVQVHREGTTFKGDSREWVFPPLGHEFTRIDNNGTLDDLRTEAGRLYGRLVNQLGWKL